VPKAHTVSTAQTLDSWVRTRVDQLSEAYYYGISKEFTAAELICIRPSRRAEEERIKRDQELQVFGAEDVLNKSFKTTRVGVSRFAVLMQMCASSKEYFLRS
jgi:hypothetical protein